MSRLVHYKMGVVGMETEPLRGSPRGHQLTGCPMLCRDCHVAYRLGATDACLLCGGELEDTRPAIRRERLRALAKIGAAVLLFGLPPVLSYLGVI